MPSVSGFETPKKLTRHFLEHGAEFAAATEGDYEALAIKFLSAPFSLDVLEGIRSDGALIRYCPATEEFGVLRTDGVIKTYFKPTPDPLGILGPRNGHPYITNLDYFKAECAK